MIALLMPPRQDRPATLLVEDRGMRAILAACDHEAALDTIMADTYGRTFDQESN